MKILFLHEVNYLTKPIFEMHEFPEHLAMLGHEVGFVQFPEGLSRSEIRELGRRTLISGRVIADSQITLFTPWTPFGSIVGRLFTAAVSYWQFKSILNEYQPDIVVSFSVPTSGWQALIASRQQGVPYMFRALDVSHKIRQGLFSSLVKRAERFIYKNSTTISANNPAMAKYCKEISNGATALTEVHLPPLNLELFAGGDRAEGRKQLNLDATQPAIMYLGSFFYFSGLPEVLQAFSNIESNAQLVLVGGGEQDLLLRDLVHDLGLTNRVTFTGFVDFLDLPSILKAADVAINPMKQSVVSDAALPNKVLQYLASGVRSVSTPLLGLKATLTGLPGIYWAETSEMVIRTAVDLANEPNELDMSLTQDWLAHTGASSVRVFEESLQKSVERQ